MGQIFVAILAGVCSKEGAAMAMKQLAHFSDEVSERRAVLDWKKNGLNEVVGS